MAISWKHGGKPNVLGIVMGDVAGLTAITPASGFMGPAIIIGAVAGNICYFAMHFKNKRLTLMIHLTFLPAMALEAYGVSLRPGSA